MCLFHCYVHALKIYANVGVTNGIVALWIEWSHFKFWCFMCWQITKLQDDNKVLDCLTQLQRGNPLVVERIMQTIETQTSMVDDLQNCNQKLLKQIKIWKVLHLFQIKELCCHSQVYCINHHHHVKSMSLKKYFLWHQDKKILYNMHCEKL
jgi:hypothetical protein